MGNVLESLFEIYEIIQDLEARCEDTEDEASDDVYNLILDVSARIQSLIQQVSTEGAIRNTQESLLKDALHNAIVLQEVAANGAAAGTEERLRQELVKALGLPASTPWDEALLDIRREVINQEPSELPRHFRLALTTATRAFQRGDFRDLGTFNEDLQPLVDAAIAWGKR